jgi:hypothetical protein
MMTPFPPSVHAQTCRGQVEHGRGADAPRSRAWAAAPRAAAERSAKARDRSQAPAARGDNDLDEEQAATAHWLAHIRAGRLEVR